MFSRDISSNRWIPLVLMMVFMLFATPTPGLEVSAGESARTSMSHGMEFFYLQPSDCSEALLGYRRLAACRAYLCLLFSAACYEECRLESASESPRLLSSANRAPFNPAVIIPH